MFSSHSKLEFSNWKKAIEKFNKHERTISHHQAVELVENIPNTILSGIHAQQKTEKRVMLQIIITTTWYLCRQGLAFQGHYKIADDSNEGCEVYSNFIQLLKTIH